MTKKTDGIPDPSLHNPWRRDRAIRLRRRVTTAAATAGVGAVGAFGVLAAAHNSGTPAVAATATPTASASSSTSASTATGAPTVAAAAAPTATAAPTAQAVTGGS